MTAAATLAVFAAGLELGDIPPDTVDTATRHTLDVLGCGLAAAALGEVPWITTAAQGSTGRASAIGVTDGVDAAAAALVNGTLCHALDFDDTHPAGIVHASAVVVPAVLAVAEERGADGTDVIPALVAGYEVVARLGMAAGTAFHERGLHPTGVCGVVGAAVAAARASRATVAQTEMAIGLAASMASGTLEFLGDGAQTKPMHAGWAAHGGVLAARFAAAGACGPAGALDGTRGLLAAYLHGRPTDLGALTAGLARRWETSNLAIKLLPACHYVHAAVDAVAELQRTHGLRPDDVAEVTVLADAATVALVLEPLDAKRVPRNAYDAKFSLPFCIAVQLASGSVGLASFADAVLADPQVRELAGRVTYERQDFGLPANEMFGGVRVRRVDGVVLDAPPRHAPGSGPRPVTGSAALRKFRESAALALDGASSRTIEAGVRSLPFGGGAGWAGALRRARSAQLSVAGTPTTPSRASASISVSS